MDGFEFVRQKRTLN